MGDNGGESSFVLAVPVWGALDDCTKVEMVREVLVGVAMAFVRVFFGSGHSGYISSRIISQSPHTGFGGTHFMELPNKDLLS